MVSVTQAAHAADVTSLEADTKCICGNRCQSLVRGSIGSPGQINAQQSVSVVQRKAGLTAMWETAGLASTT